MSVNFNDPRLLAIAEIAAITVCEQFGVDAELSYSQAADRYGRFFIDMAKAGRIVPRHIGKGRNGTRKYAVKDIIALRAEEEAKAELAK